MSDTKPTKAPAKKAAAKKTASVKKPVTLERLPSMFFVHTHMMNPSTGQQVETFSGVPTRADAPYVEVVWNPLDKKLGINSVHQKETTQYLAKLNNKGIPVRNQDQKTNLQYPVAQERLIMTLPVDYYLHDVVEVKAFLQMVAVNPDFDFDKFINAK